VTRLAWFTLWAAVGAGMWAGIIAGVLALASCATTLTPLGIAADLDADLRTTTAATENVLPLRCEAVYRAERRCVAAGFKMDCAWDTWHERDHDATVAMCLARRQP
jgi:hypothetical protein